MSAVKVVVAPDSFKGSLTAAEVCDALERGLRRVWPSAVIDKAPLADGGEGTARALVEATGGEMIACRVTGPLGEEVEAFWGKLGDGRTAVIEMAAASGLPLVPPERRDPRRTTTRGTGELIAAALDAGCSRIILGIGGSATNDGGAGMAQALGVSFKDAAGRELPPGGAALLDLATLDVSGLDERVRRTEFIVACDVDNPLLGPRGASAVYGPQKGATPDVVGLLDRALARLAAKLKDVLGKDVAEVPGAGAAGGLGAGAMAFLDAKLTPGIEIVLQAVGLAGRISDADLVITGEGMVDHQSAYGKVPSGVARLARRAGVPVVAIGGGVVPPLDDLYAMGIGAAFDATLRPMSLDEAIARAPESLERTAEAVARLFDIARGKARDRT